MFNKEKNDIFVGGENKLEKWEYPEERLKLTLKNYLELNNVSFLFGAGSSIVLGSVSIANIPTQIEDRIKNHQEEQEDDDYRCYDEFLAIISNLQKEKEEDESSTDDSDDNEYPQRGGNGNGESEITYSLEKLLNYLSAVSFLQERTPAAVSYNHIEDLLRLIKSELFQLCDLDKREPKPSEGYEDAIEKNKYHFHEMLVKKILQRPLNLRRANIFTTNYDVAFEYAFDKLGVHYIDGFSGFNRRTFKPEIFDHDIFFPGSTTQGKVHRIERVVKYFKLHGSLTWFSEERSPANTYGIREYPIDYVREMIDNSVETAGKIMIYPTTEKKSHTLDFPYSELFRQFANTISQPQSVLFTFGYAFRDEHINDIIKQALAIPSFTLVVIDYYGTEGSKEIESLKELNDPRIMIIQGEQLGDLPFFVENILPDIIESKEDEKLAETLKKLYSKNETNNDEASGSEESLPDDFDDLPDFDDIDDDLPFD